jgi:hypothetical protein
MTGALVANVAVSRQATIVSGMGIVVVSKTAIPNVITTDAPSVQRRSVSVHETPNVVPENVLRKSAARMDSVHSLIVIVIVERLDRVGASSSQCRQYHWSWFSEKSGCLAP